MRSVGFVAFACLVAACGTTSNGSSGSSGTSGGSGSSGTSGGSGDSGVPTDSGAPGSGTIAGDVGGVPVNTVAMALWIGAPDDSTTTVVYLFSKVVDCTKLHPAGWADDGRIPPGTQFRAPLSFPCRQRSRAPRWCAPPRCGSGPLHGVQRCGRARNGVGHLGRGYSMGFSMDGNVQWQTSEARMNPQGAAPWFDEGNEGHRATRCELADACWAGITEFLWLEPTDVHALGDWFRAYEQLTRPDRAPGRAAFTPVAPMPPLEALVRSAQRDVLEQLARLAEEEGFAVVADVLAQRGLVLEGAGWVPVRRRYMKLAERVMSLVAAAHLNEVDRGPAASGRRTSGTMIVRSIDDCTGRDDGRSA